MNSMDSMDTSIVEMQVTCGSDAEARAIADALVERRLAACVQQVPIRSTYRWAGAVERGDEILLLVKTTAARVDSAMAAVIDIHSYDVAAITVVGVVDGSEPYLEWVRDETR